MSNRNNMVIKYAKPVPIFMIMSSIFILGVSFLVGFSLNTITGLILLPLGVLMLTQPALILTPQQIVWRNMLGKTVKTIPFLPDEVEVVKNAVYVRGKKVLSLWWIDGGSKKIADYFEKLKEF